MKKELYFDKSKDVLWRIPDDDFSNMPDEPKSQRPYSEGMIPVECEEIYCSDAFGQFYVDDENWLDNSLRVFSDANGNLAILLPWYNYEYRMGMSNGIWVSDKKKFGYKELITCQDGNYSRNNPLIVFKDVHDKWGILSVEEYKYALPQLWVETMVEPKYDSITEVLQVANIKVVGSHFNNVRNENNPDFSEELMRYTPDKITDLDYDEVFVFGSNLQGQHHGGAARSAYEKFGAVWGLGVGLAGQSYAIPTMHGGVDAIKPYVDQFIEMAKVMKDKKFYVTKIGCGIAGFDEKDIAPLFKGALELENVALPREFVMVLKR